MELKKFGLFLLMPLLLASAEPPASEQPLSANRGSASIHEIKNEAAATAEAVGEREAKQLWPILASYYIGGRPHGLYQPTVVRFAPLLLRKGTKNGDKV